MAEFTKHQQNIIRNYYENRDGIALQRLGELATDLYLAEGKKRKTLWQQVQSAMEKLKFPPARIQQVVGSDNPALVAKLVEEVMARK